jgi:hypothetical protein
MCAELSRWLDLERARGLRRNCIVSGNKLVVSILFMFKHDPSVISHQSFGLVNLLICSHHERLAEMHNAHLLFPSCAPLVIEPTPLHLPIIHIHLVTDLVFFHEPSPQPQPFIVKTFLRGIPENLQRRLLLHGLNGLN